VFCAANDSFSVRFLRAIGGNLDLLLILQLSVLVAMLDLVVTSSSILGVTGIAGDFPR